MAPCGRTTMILASLLSLFFWGCSPPETINENSYYLSKTFSQDYDEVWDTLEHLMAEKMMLPLKTKDKDRGIIESDWVSVIRLRGTMRWKVKVLLDKRERGTTVRVSHQAEVPTEVVGKMKDKKGDVKTGWQNSEENIREVDDLLDQLANDLGD